MTAQTRSKAASFGYRVARVFSRAWHVTDRLEGWLASKTGHKVANVFVALIKLGILTGCLFLLARPLVFLLMLCFAIVVIKSGIYRGWNVDNVGPADEYHPDHKAYYPNHSYYDD